MPRHKEADRDQILKATRQALLAAAAEEFAREGYDRANVNRIAEAAGFSIGTVYNYFPSKRELMSAFIAETAQAHVAFMLKRVRQETEAERRLEAFYAAGFEFVHTHLTMARAIFNTLNGPDEDFRLQLFQAYQPLFQLLGEEILLPGADQGAFRELDPGSTAGLLMLIYLGTGSQLSPEGTHWLSAAQVADFVLHALRT